jgi:hypothetical protein
LTKTVSFRLHPLASSRSFAIRQDHRRRFQNQLVHSLVSNGRHVLTYRNYNDDERQKLPPGSTATERKHRGFERCLFCRKVRPQKDTDRPLKLPQTPRAEKMTEPASTEDVEASRNMGAMNDLEHTDNDEEWIRARMIVAGSARSNDRKEFVFLGMRDRNWGWILKWTI